jgi:hypothetical protein
MNNVYNWNFSRFVMEIELKIRNLRFVYDFRKLNKIARGGLKIQ